MSLSFYFSIRMNMAHARQFPNDTKRENRARDVSLYFITAKPFIYTNGFFFFTQLFVRASAVADFI